MVVEMSMKSPALHTYYMAHIGVVCLQTGEKKGKKSSQKAISVIKTPYLAFTCPISNSNENRYSL